MSVGHRCDGGVLGPREQVTPGDYVIVKSRVGGSAPGGSWGAGGCRVSTRVLGCRREEVRGSAGGCSGLCGVPGRTLSRGQGRCGGLEVMCLCSPTHTLFSWKRPVLVAAPPARSSTPFSVAFLDSAPPGELTRPKVTLWFCSVRVWACGGFWGRRPAGRGAVSKGPSAGLQGPPGRSRRPE